MKKNTIKQALQAEINDQEPIIIRVNGWIRTRRESKNVCFIALNDGSTIKNLQIVADTAVFEQHLLSQLNTGACIGVEGILAASAGSGQALELKATSIYLYGAADPSKYPLQPKEHSLEFLRENAHLRFRTNTFGAIFRIRHVLSYAIHDYFHQNGFYYIHSPIITGSDAEGAGEMFRVSVLDALNPPKNDEGKPDFGQDFFGKATNLTVSGQLEAELAAMALSKVYTFGPTFRAENSNTSRHLAEFWMIEPEVAFNELEDNIDLAEAFLKHVIGYALANCKDDLEFLDTRAAKEDEKKKKEDRANMGLLDKLASVVAQPFERLTYTQAIEILQNSKPAKKKQFQYDVEWGIDLQSEHERYLVEKHFEKPVVLTDYPKQVKSFYMKQNEDGTTVRAMDILFPGIGEIVGGSQREENLEKLQERMSQMNISQEELWWYLDLRRFGTAPHSGFGLGFERLVLFVTGMSNIRDVIPFPRTPQNAEF